MPKLHSLLITTHDLVLTDLAAAHPEKASNVHFEEHYRNGEMRFDYLLRPGVLSRTNGWNIMVALGLVPSSKANEEHW